MQSLRTSSGTVLGVVERGLNSQEAFIVVENATNESHEHDTQMDLGEKKVVYT